MKFKVKFLKQRSNVVRKSEARALKVSIKNHRMNISQLALPRNSAKKIGKFQDKSILAPKP